MEILVRLEAGTVTVGEAALLLSVSERQVQQRASYRQAGLASVVHGKAGRAPSNRIAEAVRVRIIELAEPGGKYHDVNVSHLQELLAQKRRSL